MPDRIRTYLTEAFQIKPAMFGRGYFEREDYRKMQPCSVTCQYRGRVLYRLSFVIERLSTDRFHWSAVVTDDAGEHAREGGFMVENVPMNYGGNRAYFLCPYCGRRCLGLFSNHGAFECRKCAGIHYESQSERPERRARRRMNNIRKRFGIDANYADLSHVEPWEKPKGMHWSTFKRLAEKHDDAADEVDRCRMRRLAKIAGLFRR